jgi:hypothetical protein
MRYPLYRSLGAHVGRSRRVWDISLPPDFEPRTVQPVASSYTDCSIPATRKQFALNKRVNGKKSLRIFFAFGTWCSEIWSVLGLLLFHLQGVIYFATSFLCWTYRCFMLSGSHSAWDFWLWLPMDRTKWKYFSPASYVIQRVSFQQKTTTVRWFCSLLTRHDVT